MSTANGHFRRRPGTARLPPVVHASEASIPADTLRSAEAQIPADSLRARRDRLAAEVAQLQWDLGGLAYEMAVRDHFRLDVLVRAAARMQDADAELAETERLLHLDERGAAGTCASCGALRSRAASFCWSCGHELMARAEGAA